jgi:hypothetical protein
VKLARENTWGAGKIQGELKKLGQDVSETTILNILRDHNIPIQPERKKTTSWRQFLHHYQQYFIACDFFTVETIFLQTIYVLFFIELGTRKVRIAGYTSQPGGEWVNQQARQLMWELKEEEREIKYLIHDRDSKFSQRFDDIFQSEGIKIIKTPVRAPNGNAYAERWVRTIREECLDQIVILNQRHLKNVIKEYETYYNEARPHQGINQNIPVKKIKVIKTKGQVKCRNVLGGIIHDYYRVA